MIPEVPGILPEGGMAIFSGLTFKERPAFLALLPSGGMVPVKEIRKGDWWGVAASRKA